MTPEAGGDGITSSSSKTGQASMTSNKICARLDISRQRWEWLCHSVVSPTGIQLPVNCHVPQWNSYCCWNFC